MFYCFFFFFGINVFLNYKIANKLSATQNDLRAVTIINKILFSFFLFFEKYLRGYFIWKLKSAENPQTIIDVEFVSSPEQIWIVFDYKSLIINDNFNIFFFFYKLWPFVTMSDVIF